MQEITVPIGWGTLKALVSGPETGKRVLFLHGWLDNAASFVPLIELFPKDWRCVVLDLPGHGHSDHRPKGTAYHLIDAVSDVLNAADALGWETFTLIGHSLGAGVASVLAGAFPGRVEKLVLLEAVGPLASTEEETPQRFAEFHTQSKGLKDKRLPVYPDLDQAVRARMHAGVITRESARRIAERGTKQVDGGITWRSDPRLRLPTQRFTEEQVRAFLRRIGCPVYCLLTDKGLVLSFPLWKERVACVTQITTEVLPGGHHLHLDSPTSVADRLIPWLA